MFDIGFWELLLIFVLGLLVLGPERLPRVARTIGLWAGRARSYVRQLSTELDRELQTEELKRQFRETHKAVKDSVDDVRKSVGKGSSSSDDKKPDQ